MSPRRSLLIIAVLATTAAIGIAPLVRAQSPALAPARVTAQPVDVNRHVASMLVKNALVALNHANLTGNYTVLRDLGGPAFRERHSAAQLAMTYQNLREQQIDLSPILMAEPQFTAPPAVNGEGRLELSGYFPTEALLVRFQILCQMTPAGWMIDSVAVGTAGLPPLPASTPIETLPMPPISSAPTSPRPIARLGCPSAAVITPVTLIYAPN